MYAIRSYYAEGVTAQTRYDEKNTFVFIMNFTPKMQKVILNSKDKYADIIDEKETGKHISLPAYGIKILKSF